MSAHMFRDGALVAIAAPSGQIIGLKAAVMDTMLHAVQTHKQAWEVFRVHKVGADKIALESLETGRYWSATPDGCLLVRGGTSDAWETFTVLDRLNGTFSLRGHNGKFVCCEEGGGSILTCNRQDPCQWETLRIAAIWFLK